MFPEHLPTLGLATLAFLYPTTHYLEAKWEAEAVNEIEQDMCANTYQNGVLFGLWAAGVAISVGRLLTYVIKGGPMRTEDKVSQTDDIKEGDPDVEDKTEGIHTETAKQVVESEKPTKEEIGDGESSKVITKQQTLDHGDTMATPTTATEVDDDHGVESQVDQCKNKEEDVDLDPDMKISVYKLPAIKKHHFLIRLDGMNALRQSIQGNFSLQKVALDGIRNFLFIVAKGSPSQLSELEAKIHTDFRWLTPVREPSTKLTCGVAIQEPRIPRCAPVTQASCRPTKIPARVSPNGLAATKSPVKSPSQTKAQ